ncbi:GNAT family N-acetyltransferase [uncultured Ramlibacter sp.]|uniref:GNAT family N-acetyltransferase n=1 Tax=uncultured Ramlibacter sp. TaxID=260755 RepID=UPI00261C2B12|nr:GNAT family N-acetyltransferase [uncultured Ramlibacter sp.]
MSSYQVRPAAIADAAQVAEIHASSSQAIYSAVLPEQPVAMPMDKRKTLWREAIEFGDPQVHVVVQGAQIVGFVGFDRSRDPKSKPTTGEIWALYVLQAHWDQGAGLALWDAAREELIEEGCTEVTMWVPLRNERALRFAELAGFKRELTTAKTSAIGGVKIEEIRLKRKLD